MPSSSSVTSVQGLTIHLDDLGRIAGSSVLGLTGETQLEGCQTNGLAERTVSGEGYAFTRKVVDAQQHEATITDTFTPNKDSIRWEVEITSADAPWTAPIISRMQCVKPEETQMWTAWGSPDLDGVQLTPELTALLQAGKASLGGEWSDPLTPIGFVNRDWHYGNVSQPIPVGNDYVVLPVFTLLAPASDTGFSLVLDPNDVLLTMDLSVNDNGQFQYCRTNHRIGGGKTLKFGMDLVLHEASWRGGLRFMTHRYPLFFLPPNPRAHQIAGCGAYSICEAPIDAEKLRKMAFGFNWKLSDDFPYMGMFLPPVKDVDESWTRSCGEPSPPGKGATTSCRQMNDYAQQMKVNGFSVLSYFNVNEFGKNVNPLQDDRQTDPANNSELWRNCSAYMRANFPQAWLRVPADQRTGWASIALPEGMQGLVSNCYGAAIVDPGDRAYLQFLLEQCRRNIRWLPDTDGICIDRTDWLRFFNSLADDGVSWAHGKPARSLFRSWAALMAEMGPLMHDANKVIFANLMTMRLELGRHLDAIYTEFGNNGIALNASALLGLHKPVVAWTNNDTLSEPDPDGFMQRHLHLGVFPTAPYPFNNHCITPEPKADRLYLDYGPLLGAMRGRQWVLTPGCVKTSTPGIKVNLFQVPDGYAVPVTFGGTLESAMVAIRLPGDREQVRCEALYPGGESPVPLQAKYQENELKLQVPLKRGCAMVLIKRPL